MISVPLVISNCREIPETTMMGKSSLASIFTATPSSTAVPSTMESSPDEMMSTVAPTSMAPPTSTAASATMESSTDEMMTATTAEASTIETTVIFAPATTVVPEPFHAQPVAPEFGAFYSML